MQRSIPSALYQYAKALRGTLVYSVHANTFNDDMSFALSCCHSRLIQLHILRRTFCSAINMTQVRRSPKSFLPLHPDKSKNATAPPLKGIVFDVDGTLWYVQTHLYWVFTCHMFWEKVFPGEDGVCACYLL